MEILFICKCGDPAHQLIISKFEGEIFVTVHLKPLPWYKRIINAVKYIFGYRSIYGEFTEFIFNEKDSEKLQEIIDYLKNYK